jgi:hypothetical protein
VFKAQKPAEGSKPNPGLVALETGERIVFNVLAVTDGATAKVDAKELEMAKDYLGKNAGQRDLSAYVAQLRATGDVFIKTKQQ